MAGEKGQTVNYVLRHLRFGWWTVLGFLALGMALEAMHGWKLGWYLDTDNETRRLLFTLAHAHGVLLGLMHLGFAFTQHVAGERSETPPRLASRCLVLAGVLVPAGFLLGGLQVHSGDPGLGILLVPPGAVLLFVAILNTGMRLKGK